MLTTDLLRTARDATADPSTARPLTLPPDLPAALLDCIDFGVAACDLDGRLLHVNRAGRRVLDGGGPLALRQGQLCCRRPGPQAQWQLALREAVQRRRGRMVSFHPADRPDMVVAMPLNAADGEAPAALVLMGRSSMCSPLGLELLSTHYALTFAERRVLRALVEQRSPRDIAADHGVSLATVRTQVLAVRAKLNAHNVDAVLARAAEVPPVMSWH